MLLPILCVERHAPTHAQRSWKGVELSVVVFDNWRVPDKEERRKYVQHGRKYVQSAAQVPGVTHRTPRAGVRGVLKAMCFGCRIYQSVSAHRACQDPEKQTFLQEASWKSVAAVTRVAVKSGKFEECSWIPIGPNSCLNPIGAKLLPLVNSNC